VNFRRTEWIAAAVLLALFLLTLIPILALGVYDRPSSDDYGYGKAAHDALVAGGGFPGAWKAAVEQVASVWLSWQGSFSGILLMGLQPAVFSDAAYAITPFVLLASLCLSTLWLVKVLIQDLLGAKPWPHAFLVAIPMLALAVQYPVSAVEAFFWWNGAVYYTFFYSLMLCFVGLQIRLYLSCASLDAPHPRARLFLRVCGTAALGLFLSGGNFCTGLLAAILTLGMTGLYFIRRKPLRARACAVVVFAIFLAGFAVNVSAPGNAVRQAYFPRQTVLDAVSGAVRWALGDIRDFTSVQAMVAILALLPLFALLAMRSGFAFRYPLLFFALSFCVFAAQYIPSFYAGMAYGPDRMRNIEAYSYYWFLFLNAFYLMGWVVRVTNLRAESVYALFADRRRWAAPFLALALLFLGVAYVSRDGATSVLCLHDLASDRAAIYAEEVDAAIAYVREHEGERVELQNLSVRPESLFFSYPTADRKNYLNTGFAKYYHLKSVVVPGSEE
jgi:hypothetical protein